MRGVIFQSQEERGGIVALRQSNAQAGSWSLEKVQVPPPRWQAFMRCFWHYPPNTVQEDQIENVNTLALVNAIADLSKEAVEFLHTSDPRGELSLSSAGPAIKQLHA